MPEATQEQMHWFNELEKVSTSADNAVRFQTEVGQIDVLDRLPHIKAPTIVFHSQKDGRVPFEEGRRLAALIPKARFVPLESRNHILLEGEPAWGALVSEVNRFLNPEVAIQQKLSLTSRELEVLRLIAQGKSDKQVAVDLSLSSRTVENHVKHVLRKMGCGNRTEAAAQAVRLGMT